LKVNEPLAFDLPDLITATPEVFVVPLAEPLTTPLHEPVTVAPATGLFLSSRMRTSAVASAWPLFMVFRLTVMPATAIGTTTTGELALIVTIFVAVNPALSVIFSVAV
jgi:hypothetical protein